MIRRLDRDRTAPLRRLAVSKRKQLLETVYENRDTPELALRYTNGFVTVEISHDAVDAYAVAHGDVPLPIHVDAETGDRRTYDAFSRVRVIYDREARLREVTTRGRDGLYVRFTLLERAARPDGGGYQALGHVPDEEREDAGDDRAAQAEVDPERQPGGAGDEDHGRPDEDGGEAAAVAFVEAAFVERADEPGGEREADEVAAGGAGEFDQSAGEALQHG
jgi:hypothetical protein